MNSAPSPRSRWRAGIAAFGALALGGAVAAAMWLPASPAAAAAPAIAPPVTFASTAAEQTYTVPRGVRLVETDVNGANGGGGAIGMPLGGYLKVRAHETLFVEVGSNGTYEGGATFGGGGAAGTFEACPQPDPDGRCGGAFASSGGGASDIRTCSERVEHCRDGGTSTQSRLIVAGGGGGEGGEGESAGFYCTQEPQKGAAYNRQALPGGTPLQGPVPIAVSNGLVIPGEPSNYTYGAIADVTPSQGGSTSPGTAGSMGTCNVVGGDGVVDDTFSGSIRGSDGSGSAGGAGADVLGNFAVEPGGWLPGAGGGGGGGYTGGGGGSTGDVCSFAIKGSCNDPSGGQGGGGGASFLSSRILGGFIQDGPAPGPSITITPLIEIDRPANGAVYAPGHAVEARWECGNYQNNSCRGTTASGARIDMRPGRHTFKVSASVFPTSDDLSTTVTYTVRAGGGRRGGGH